MDKWVLYELIKRGTDAEASTLEFRQVSELVLLLETNKQNLFIIYSFYH